MSLDTSPSLDHPLLLVSVDVPTGRLALTGEFDHWSAHLLVDALPVLSAGPGAEWRIDAAAVTFCDAGGLAALVQAHRYAAAEGRRMRLVSVSPCVRRLIDMAGVRDLLPVEGAAG